VTSSWFFLSTLNYDARSTTQHITMHGQPHNILRCTVSHTTY